jgi:hypothetical protein
MIADGCVAAGENLISLGALARVVVRPVVVRTVVLISVRYARSIVKEEYIRRIAANDDAALAVSAVPVMELSALQFVADADVP